VSVIEGDEAIILPTRWYFGRIELNGIIDEMDGWAFGAKSNLPVRAKYCQLAPNAAFAKATAQTNDATELRPLVLDNPPCVICNCDLDFFPITILTKLRITVPNYA